MLFHPIAVRMFYFPKAMSASVQIPSAGLPQAERAEQSSLGLGWIGSFVLFPVKAVRVDEAPGYVLISNEMTFALKYKYR